MPGLGAEIDYLVAEFNSMATTLNETERSRQQLLGDMAHELRTPLATIRACHEALADGVRQPDAQTWALLGARPAGCNALWMTSRPSHEPKRARFR